MDVHAKPVCCATPKAGKTASTTRVVIVQVGDSNRSRVVRIRGLHLRGKLLEFSAALLEKDPEPVCDVVSEDDIVEAVPIQIADRDALT